LNMVSDEPSLQGGSCSSRSYSTGQTPMVAETVDRVDCTGHGTGHPRRCTREMGMTAFEGSKAYQAKVHEGVACEKAGDTVDAMVKQSPRCGLAPGEGYTMAFRRRQQLSGAAHVQRTRVSSARPGSRVCTKDAQSLQRRESLPWSGGCRSSSVEDQQRCLRRDTGDLSRRPALLCPSKEAQLPNQSFCRLTHAACSPCSEACSREQCCATRAGSAGASHDRPPIDARKFGWSPATQARRRFSQKSPLPQATWVDAS